MVTSNAATGYVAKISMLRLNIGSGKLSSCMLSIGRGPKAVQGKGGGCPPLPCSHLGPRPMLSMHELSLPEPMLSLSMLILAMTLCLVSPSGGNGQARSASSRPAACRTPFHRRPPVWGLPILPKCTEKDPKMPTVIWYLISVMNVSHG